MRVVDPARDDQIENACAPRAYLCVFRVVAHRRESSRRGMSSAWERFSLFLCWGGTRRRIMTRGAHTEQNRTELQSFSRFASSHPCARRWATRTPPRRHRPRRRTARGRTARGRSVRARGCVTACSRLMIDERVNEKYRCVVWFSVRGVRD